MDTTYFCIVDSRTGAFWKPTPNGPVWIKTAAPSILRYSYEDTEKIKTSLEKHYPELVGYLEIVELTIELKEYSRGSNG